MNVDVGGGKSRVIVKCNYRATPSWSGGNALLSHEVGGVADSTSRVWRVPDNEGHGPMSHGFCRSDGSVTRRTIDWAPAVPASQEDVSTIDYGNKGFSWTLTE